MARKTRFITALLIGCAALLSHGCVQAARTGLTNGVSSGVKAVIQDMVEQILSDLLNQN